ncbi:MAG: hypothetical protein WC716_16195 [Chitinophagaceae bacterium]
MNEAEANVYDYHPLSTYTYEWDGVTSVYGSKSLPFTPGTHTVCVTERTSEGLLVKPV